MTSHISTKRIYCCLLAAAALFVPSLSVDAQVTGYQGDYTYDDGSYSGITDDVINGSVSATQYVHDTVAGATDFLNRNSSFGLWRADNHSYAIAGAGLGTMANIPGLWTSNGVSLHSTGGASPDPWFGFKLGSFYVDEVYGGVGAMYSDIQGQPIYGGPGAPGSDDNWAAIIWARARFTAYITDRLAISINPSVYWLPLTNEVGWGVGSLMLGMGAVTGPTALVQMALRFPLEGGFEVGFFEEFRAIYPNVSIIRNSPYYWATLSDSSPVDYAGRYQFGGYGGSHQIDSGGKSDFKLNDTIYGQEFMTFMNRASFSLRGRHGNNVYSNIYYDRLDYWDSNFDDHQGWQTIGALLIQQGPVVSPYARYELVASDHFANYYHYGVVGANMRFSPDVTAYAEAGWLSAEREFTGNTNSWIAQAGARQRLGPYTQHGFDVGRSPVESFRSRYLSTYAQYYLTQQIGPSSSVMFFIQRAELDVLGDTGAVEREGTIVGVNAETHLSSNSTLSFNASYENADMASINRAYELWTYRMMYSRQFNPSVSGLIYYQYQEAGSGINALDQFSEHLLFVGMTKRF